MTGDGWNHNTHYHDRLLNACPRPCARALDVGCGTGTFARRMAGIAAHVDAVDADSDVVRRARDCSTHVPNLRIVEADFMTWRADGPYDVVSMIAVLHHLPFLDALARAADLLRPRGVLAVLGLHRAASIVHAGARGLIAYPLSGYYRATRRTSEVGAPIREPTMTLREIRRGAEAVLPGSSIRRLVLWRYSLIWMKR